MSWEWEGLSSVRPVRVELITVGYRITGTIHTRFSRVAEILNQLSSTHLPVDDATVEEHAGGASQRAGATMVTVEEILVMVAPDLADAPSGDMRVPKQPLRARLAVPPLWLHGTVYVPVGSRPTDGLLNLSERFMPMTDVAITSAAHPRLDHHGPVAAVRRDRAHVILFDDEPADGASDGEGEAEPAGP
jgi:hypothetical protein